MGADPASLSLIGKTDFNSEILGALITDSLVKYDANLEPKPRLAESWQVSGDGLVWTFRLRDGVRWQDGTPVTADDVVFTVNKVREPATESRSYLPAFQDLVTIEARDARTVQATYRAPYADVLDAWTLPILPAHLAGKEPNLLTSEYARKPVGCGPYRLARAEPGKEYALEPNADYWDGPPDNGGIVFRVIPSERTAYDALLRGDIDLMPVNGDLFAESEGAASARPLSRFVFWRLGVFYISWNQDGSNPFFGDARVRRAMIQALDRPQFAARVLHGLAKPAITTYPPESMWADHSLAPWSFDAAESKRLLAEAGWTDSDGDGVVDRDGVPFRFTLMYPVSAQELVERIAVWIQQSLTDAGVGVSLEKLEWRSFQERRGQHRFHAAMASLSLSPAADTFELYHSTARDTGRNYAGLHDDEIDRLLSDGRREFDLEKRKEIYFALQRRLHELEPISCLFHFAIPQLHDARIQGIAPSPLGIWTALPGPARWRFEGEGPAG